MTDTRNEEGAGKASTQPPIDPSDGSSVPHQWLDAWPFVASRVPTLQHTLGVRVPSGVHTEFDLAILGELGSGCDEALVLPPLQALWAEGFLVPACALVCVFEHDVLLGLDLENHREDELPGGSFITYKARVGILSSRWCDSPYFVTATKLTPPDIAFAKRLGLGEERNSEFELPVPPTGRQS